MSPSTAATRRLQNTERPWSSFGNPCYKLPGTPSRNNVAFFLPGILDGAIRDRCPLFFFRPHGFVTGSRRGNVLSALSAPDDGWWQSIRSCKIAAAVEKAVPLESHTPHPHKPEHHSTSSCQCEANPDGDVTAKRLWPWVVIVVPERRGKCENLQSNRRPVLSRRGAGWTQGAAPRLVFLMLNSSLY